MEGEIMLPLTVPPRDNGGTFFGFPHVVDLDHLNAHVAMIGLPHGNPYSIADVSNDQTNGPSAIRRVSRRISLGLDMWDFDIGGTLFDGRPIRAVDVGDVPADPRQPGEHFVRAEAAARRIFTSGALLIAVGGDHGVPIPVLKALSDVGPVSFIQIDAHLDWRDEVNGVREGYSSVMRRASEMAHIESIHQIGIRGQGSARPQEVEAARRYGANIVSAFELQDQGVGAILSRIPDGGRYYITIDADALDPAVMPAVGLPAPGGLSYREVIGLTKGLVRKGRLLGMDLVDFSPARDVNEITAITGGHIILNVIGAAVRANYFG